jgi:hypothetical protein
MRDVLKDVDPNRQNTKPNFGKHDGKISGTEPSKTSKNKTTTTLELSSKMSALGVSSTSKSLPTTGLNAKQKAVAIQKSTADTKSVPMTAIAEVCQERKVNTSSQTTQDKKAIEEAQKKRRDKEE